MSTILEVTNKGKDFLKWFMEVRKEFPDVKLTKSGDDVQYMVYFIGDKTVGSDYELTCWRDVPILQNTILQYTCDHPTKALQYFLSLRLNFRGHSSSEDWLLNEEDFKAQVRLAFTKASKEFLTQHV